MGVHPSHEEILAFCAARIIELGGEEGEIGRWVASEYERRQAAIDEARHVPIHVGDETLEIGQLYKVTYQEFYFGRDDPAYPPRIRTRRRLWLHGRLLNGNVAFREFNPRRQYGEDSWGTGRYGRGGYVIMRDTDILSITVMEDISPGLQQAIDRASRGHLYRIPGSES